MALLFVAAPVAAQETTQAATAMQLEVVASDGTRIPIGMVSGRIEVTPARRASERFGPLHVHAGLDFDAHASAESAVPAFIVGDVGGLLRAAEGTRELWVYALHGHGTSLRAHVIIADVELDSVPVAITDVRVEGEPPLRSGVEWAETGHHVASGTTRLCAERARRCARLRSEQGLPVEVLARDRGWAHVRASTASSVIEGWVPDRVVVESDLPNLLWAAGRGGAVSDGCPYEGVPAVIATGTDVHLTPSGPVWAHVPQDADSVWAHDTQPGSAWVEITFARGIQRAYPGMTCSTGWVPRESVTWDVLHERGLTLAREERDARYVAVVREVPAWLAEGGILSGDAILEHLARGQAYGVYSLDDLRRELGIGGRFRIDRDGVVREIDVPLAPGCDEPGLGQPADCRPR